MDSVAIVGVGLIGGSFGLALRAAGFNGRIVGVSSERTIKDAIACGAIDEGVSLERAANTCELIYLGQPISAILDTLERLAPLIGPETLVTDVGSTKVRIVEKAQRLFPSGQFLGGHPMAGKETRGVQSASADLFRQRPYILTPCGPSQMDTPAVGGFVRWVQRCGAHIVTTTPSAHDRAVAFTSHLPQLSSTGLAAILAESLDSQDHLELAGPGLSDMTRLGLSSYEIWRDIVDTNTGNIEHALNVYIDKLTELRDNLQTQRLGDVFATAAGVAKRIRMQNANRGSN